MAKPKPPPQNFSDPKVKLAALTAVRQAEGWQEWEPPKPWHPPRSVQQNRAGWGMLDNTLCLLLEATWGVCTPQKAHDAYLCERYGSYEVKAVSPLTGLVVVGREPNRRTHEMTTEEYATYWDEYRDWLAENWGANLPDPDPSKRKTPLGPADYAKDERRQPR